ncbi:MAG: GNAT family N-acetyltransferase, partial [Chloroflexi bacterium]
MIRSEWAGGTTAELGAYLRSTVALGAERIELSTQCSKPCSRLSHLDAAYHLSVMKGYEIRVAVAADADVLKDLHRQSSLVYEDTRAILIAHPEIFGVSDAAIRAGHVRVLVSDGRIVAFSTVIPRPDGTGEMEDLFVEPKSMRQGLGRELIDDAIAIARTRGLQRI